MSQKPARSWGLSQDTFYRYKAAVDEGGVDADRLIEILREKKISDKDKSVTGFNIGMNSDESTGQTIFHCHIHLTPEGMGYVG